MVTDKLLIGPALLALALPSLAQYSVSGGGGPFPPGPGTGGGGDSATMLPTEFSTFPLSTPVPPGATSITSVTITGITHTWVGDLQVVLWDPSMTQGYNLFVRIGLPAPLTCCGNSGDFLGGTYTVVAPGDPSITVPSWPAAGNPPPGTYPQEYGLSYGTGWVSGSANVFNTSLDQIPVVPGIWTLVVYDGAGGDVGAMSGWSMSGDSGPAPNSYCFGDGSGLPCPCANAGAPGNGCASSVSPIGARLASTGSATISSDTLALVGSQMPNSSALYFQGTAKVNGGSGAHFGDGLRCAGGTIIRLGARINTAGTSQFPGAGGTPVHIKGNVVAGNTRDYQVWYRNAAPYCNPETYNMTNALELTWAP